MFNFFEFIMLLAAAGAVFGIVFLIVLWIIFWIVTWDEKIRARIWIEEFKNRENRDE